MKYLLINNTQIIQIPSVESFYLCLYAQLQDYEQAELNQLKEYYEFNHTPIEEEPTAFAGYIISISQRADSKLPRLAWCSVPTLLGHPAIWFSFKLICIKPKIDMINYVMNLIGRHYVIERDYNLIHSDKCIQLDVMNIELLSDIQVVNNLWSLIQKHDA